MSQLACQSIEFAEKVIAERDQSDDINFSKNIFDTSSFTGYPEVLQVPPNAERATNELLKIMANKQGHCIMGADAAALVACSYDRSGIVLILDHSPARTEAIRYVLRLAAVVQDHTIWNTFIEASFPNAASYLRGFVTPQTFDRLVANIRSNKVIFVHSDLSAPNAHSDIVNFLVAGTGHASVAVIYAEYLENDISEKIVTEDWRKLNSNDDEHATFEKELVLEKRRAALENFQDNIKALAQRETLMIGTENNSIQLFDQAKIKSEWHIRARVPLALISKEVSEGAILAKTYDMAHELQNSFENILFAHPEELTANYVPLFDTLVKKTDYWHLSFIDMSNTEYTIRTIETKEPIFDKISAFVRKMSVEHISVAGSTALNLIFSAQAICHWIESGLKPNIQATNISKSLVTAVQIHFFVGIVSVVQGIAESGYVIGALSLKQGIKGALAISALKPYVQMAIALLKVSSSGKILMSLGRFVSKSLPVIGLVLNVADLGLNVYQVVNNEDPYLQPALVTNLVFSGAAFSLSVAAIAAAIAGFSSLGGPLAIAGLAVAAASIPVSHFVGQFTAAKYIGSIIKTIANELKHGGYKKIEENVEHKLHKFLAAPTFVAVTDLELSSHSARVTYGSMEYRPSDLKPKNHFFDRFRAEDEYFMYPMKSNIPIDTSYRTIMMPCLPGYVCTISNEYVPFSSSRNDAEFQEALQIQQQDPGFKFKVSQLGVGDTIAGTFSMYYQDTVITINILESDWNLIFPWVKLDSEDSSKDFTEKLNKSLRKISYDIRARSSGKQTIVLPGLDCLVRMRLHCQHVNVSWFIEFSDQSVSNEDLRFEEGKIKIGNNQNIQLLGQASKTYILVPNYQDSETKYRGRAYFDVANNHYIYNKEATNKEQSDAKLLFSSKKYAYFYSTNQADVTNASDEIWCVQIDTKKVIFKHVGVKQLQKQGEGLVFLDGQGIFYHLGIDFTSQVVNCQIIGFNETWFNQRVNPSKALHDANEFLEKNPRNQVIFFRLPYHTGNNLTGNILYNFGRKKCFILSAKYANAKFLKFDTVNQNAYYLAFDENELIRVKGLDLEETSKKLLIDQNKTKIHPNDPCAVLLKRVIGAYIVEKGVRVRLSSGLLVVFHVKLYQGNLQTHIDIEKIVVLAEEFESKGEQEVSSILQEKLSLLETKHFGESIRNGVKVNIPNLIGIEYNRNYIGCFQKSHQSTLSVNQLPRAQSITPLGTDESFAYHIVNGEKIVKTGYVTKLKDLKVLPEKSLKDEVIPFLQGEAFELFDQVLFLKKESFEADFSNKIGVLAKLPGVNTVWLESKKYTLKMGLLKNITISSIDFSEVKGAVDIKFQINIFDGYFLERDLFDLYIHNPQQNCFTVFKGVFKPEAVVPSFPGLSLIIEDSQLDVLNFPKLFNLSTMLNKYGQNNTPIFTNDRPSYSHINIIEIIKSVVSLAEVKNVIDTLLWPGEEKKVELLKALEWIHQNLAHERSKYVLAYFKIYPNLFKNFKKQTENLDNIFHLSVKDGKIGIFNFFMHALKEHSNFIKAFVLQGDKNGETILHCEARNHNFKVFAAILDGLKENIGEEAFKKLILQNNTNNETCLHAVVNFANSEVILSFWNDIKRYSDKKTLEELVERLNDKEQTFMHVWIQKQRFDSIVTLMRDVKNVLGPKILAKLLLKKDGAGSAVIHYMAAYGTNEAFKAFWEEIQKLLEKEILKEMILEKNAARQNVLNILLGRPQNDSVQLLLTSVGKIFEKKILDELLSNS